MMELRAGPGEILDQVFLGKRFVVTRAGKPLALLRPLDETTINPDGSWAGERPLTMGRNLGDV